MTTELERRDLEARIRRKRRKLEQDLEHGTGPWLAGVWARAAAGGSALGFVTALITGMPPVRLFDPGDKAFWVTVALGPVLGTLTAAHRWWDARRERRRSLDDAVREAEAELSRYRGPGWIRRTLGMGGLMGLGVGVPVGLLIAFGFPPSELPSGSPLLALVGFVGMTMGWTLPMAFLVRWLAVRQVAERTSPPPLD